MFSTKRKPPTAPLLDAFEVEIAHLSEYPPYAKAKLELDALRSRLSESESAIAEARKRQRGARPKRTVAERAAALVAGARITFADPKIEIQNREAEIGILLAAACAKELELAAIADEYSFQVASKFADQNRAAIEAAYRAVRDLAQAYEAVTAIWARVRLAGCQPNSVSLPGYVPHAVRQLGDPKNPYSEAAEFGRWLAARGWNLEA